MGNVLAYSGIVTKVRSMEARLLTQKDFEAISNMRSVPEIVAFLIGNSTYGEVLEKLEPELVHRGNIEKLLELSLYQDYTKIYRFCSLEQRRFLRLYLKRYEVELINYCLRIVINHYQEPFDLEYKKPFFDRYSKISIDMLVRARTTDELIEKLRDTEYYETLRKLRDGHEVTLFDYDLALNLYYFTSLWYDRKKVLKRKELEIFTRDCGVKINLLNLQWIYRAKKYFRLTPADIYALLIPIHYKISTELIRELVEAETPEAFLERAARTPYGRKYELGGEYTVEKMYADCLRQLYTADRRSDPYSIASVNTYLFMKEQELEKLTTAIECVRYGVSPGETLEYVGGRRI